MKKKIQKIVKSKKFPIYLTIFIICMIMLISLINFLFPGNSGSNYGNRLKGIKKYPITKKIKSSITENLSSKENVSDPIINVHGRIINIVFNVNSETSVDDAKAIAGDVKNVVPENIRSFYDIQVLITKKDEVGEEVQVNNEDGTTSTKTKKQFPIIGYKNTSQSELVW